MKKLKNISRSSIAIVGVFAILFCFNCVSVSGKAYISNSPAINSTSQSLPIVAKATINNTILKPPADFNPLNATPADLKKYGFPSKPTDETSLKSWTRVMEHAINYVAPDQTALDPKSYPTNGLVDSEEWDNWAGYVQISSDNSNASYQEAFGDITVTQYTGTACPSYWYGMGGYNDSNIVQAGFWTNADHNGGSSHCEFWVEDFPNGTILEANPYIAPYDEVSIDVSEGTTTSTAFLENLSRNTYTTITFNTPYLSHNSADAICEAAGPVRGLFGDNQFLNADLLSDQGYSTFGNKNYRRLFMANVNSGAIDSSGNFQIISH